MEARKRFKEIRKRYGLSMGEFGSKIGLSASGVSAIESGTRTLSEKHIKLTCAAFPEVNEEWLRSGVGLMIDESRKSLLDALAETYSLSPLERDIIRAFLDMDPEQQKVFLDMARALKR